MTETVINPSDLAAIEAVNKIEAEHAPLHALLNAEFQLTKDAAAGYVNEPVSANCHTEFHAVHTSGKRPLKVIDLIVIHDTEGGTARGAASYFTTPQSGGSTQLVVDDNTCYRCLDDDQIPWGAPGANYNGFHIEQAGYVSWTSAIWKTAHRKTIMRAAYKTAFHCKRYGISTRFLTAANLKAGMRNGITTHAECSKAFGGTHTDPGKNWPRLLFMILVRTYAATIKIPRVA